MWAALHVVKASVSIVGGSWSDRIGRRTVIAIGWLVYAVVYAGFAISETLPALLGWFLLYGFYFGFAEGTEKALIADLAPADAPRLRVRHLQRGARASARSPRASSSASSGARTARRRRSASARALALLATALLFAVVRHATATVAPADLTSLLQL